MAGVKGNHNFGTLLPIDYIPGLVGAELSDVLVPGEDAESDEELRQRYKLKTTRPATSGNKYHYEQWAAEVPGVGAAKIFPLWHGAGTVKVVIVDATNSPASPTLIQDVQAYISPSAGMGGGKAPIGAQVTVASAIGKAIHISATITLASGYSLQQVNDHFISAVRDYFREIGFTTSYLSIAKIGTILLDTLGILDYSALKLNSGMVNVAIAEEEIPTLGTVSLVV
ncbi:Baseplate J-like protein [compost metagenome]